MCLPESKIISVHGSVEIVEPPGSKSDNYQMETEVCVGSESNDFSVREGIENVETPRSKVPLIQGKKAEYSVWIVTVARDRPTSFHVK